MHTILLMTTELVVVVHLVMAIVLYIYARRSVAYLAQAWILFLTSLIFGVALGYLCYTTEIKPIGMLNPLLLISLMVLSFLQSVNPLGMVMPGYLQFGRMVKYALPAAGVIVLYLIGLVAGSKVVEINSLSDLHANLLSGDVLLRLAALILSFYYIVNIIIIPHRLIRNHSLPSNVVTYATLLGMIQLLFFVNTLWFSYTNTIIYEFLYTAVTMMLCGCIINPLMQAQPYPEIQLVETPPTNEEIAEVEDEDFNEANSRRFESIEYAMQHEKPYVSADFNRDRLCRLAGFNRHVVLQTIRSQGYNDVHDYISRYRVTELRRLVEEGEITDVRQHERVGFRTLKTALTSFERYEHESLPDFIARHKAQ